MASVKSAKRVHDLTQMKDDDEREAKRRRSLRGQAAITELAHSIVQGKKVVFISGAGLSVASGVRPFRNRLESTTKTSSVAPNGPLPQAGLWQDVIWCTATRETFRKDPVSWYNSFWIPHFGGSDSYKPNAGHLALSYLQDKYDNVQQITQNIDGLQCYDDREDPDESAHVIEAHGRVGLFKCVPDSDSDTDSDSDDDEDRPVQLGHRRKSREQLIKLRSPDTCPYQYLQSLHVSQLEPDSVRDAMVDAQASNNNNNNNNAAGGGGSTVKINEAPRCPACNNIVLPQALLFDEGYHSHAFYQFERMEEALADCDIIVFVGTSFAVRLTDTALKHAREKNLPVYNFNLHDPLESTARLNATNIRGPASETLTKLVKACERLERGGLIKAENE